MAKFIKIVEDCENGTKYITYINLDNVTYIYALGRHGTAVNVIGQDEAINVSIPLSDFMDLVNSQK